jgi:hypothetical protein
LAVAVGVGVSDFRLMTRPTPIVLGMLIWRS